MVSAYTAPGVYYERVDASTPAISAIRTDIAGFVGIARRGPLDTPVPIQSWRQFQGYFGDVTGAGFLAYAVRGFFENGGRRCWIVRVASREEAGGAATAGITLYGPSGAPIWRVVANSPGVWGNDLTLLVRESSEAQTAVVRGSSPVASLVASTAGFRRGSLVRLKQENRKAQWKVVSDIDAVASRLIWVHPAIEARLPYDSPLNYDAARGGFDPDAPILIQSVEYTILVRERGRQLAQFDGLSLVPEHPAYGPRILARQLMPTERDAMVPVAPRPLVVEELRDVAAWNANGPVTLEPLQPAARTTLETIIDPRRLRLASLGGLSAGTAIELLNPPPVNETVGPPLTVLVVDAASGNLATLAGDGLTPAQSAAQAVAVPAGLRVTVRALGGAPSELPLEGGADGLARLTANDFIGESISPWDNDDVRAMKRRGIRALDLIDEVAIVAAPDIHVQPARLPEKAPPLLCEPDPCLPPPVLPAVPRPQVEGDLPPMFSEDDIYRVQAMLVQHCEDRRDRIALLDSTAASSLDARTGVSLVRAWRNRFESKYAALYYPWLRVVDPLRLAGAIVRAVPPSGHIAGRFARSDFDIGVHKAPANSPLVWAEDVTLAVDDSLHGVLNPLGINVIKALPSRGLRVMGARTVSSDPDWRFVNVRRLMMMIEKAVDLSTRWVTFESNDHYTRAQLALSLTSFLLALWQRGALSGPTPAAAFFVRCDETNNPPHERENGRFLAEVGVAPSNPFEFIVLRVGRTDNQFEIAEVPGGGGGAWLS
jgi:phage tail sheath protein FI